MPQGHKLTFPFIYCSILFIVGVMTTFNFFGTVYVDSVVML